MRKQAGYGLTVVLCFGAASSALAGQLALGRAVARPGQSATVPLTFRQGAGAPAAAVSTDIQFDASALGHPRCESGAALSSGGKTVKCSERQAGSLRVLIFGLNLDPVPSGEVGRVVFDVLPTARHRSYRLRHQANAADARGKEFPLVGRSGTIRVESTQ